MTYASSKAPNVRALVYVASFGLDQGVSANQSVADYPPPELASSVEVRTFPNGAEPGLEALIQRDKFHSAFCADLPAEEAAVYGASQRPVAVDALDEPLAVQPGWKTIPSWFVIAGADHSINPDSQRAAAARMGATTVEIEGGSHSIALSRPARVAGVVVDAAAAVAGRGAAAVGRLLAMSSRQATAGPRGRASGGTSATADESSARDRVAEPTLASTWHGSRGEPDRG